MKFYDKVKISLESGRGGDGCVSGRHETGIPFGGPSGGNGGQGGSVYIQSDENINTLIDYKYRKEFKAENGEPGRSKEQYGANAGDLILKVPVGTIILDANNDKIIHFFQKHNEKVLVVKGGQGGQGNMEFRNSILQYPNFATYGEPGHSIDVVLELQLLGDVALIGNPSVGKSSLINTISNTKAKVADYHFTTLVPHLGTVKLDDFSFNIIDIPGLIKGASNGKGLGNDFLRHILKSKVFCLMGDLYRFDKGIDELVELFGELFVYIKKQIIKSDDDSTLKFFVEDVDGKILFNVSVDDEIVFSKVFLFVFNKYDLINDEEISNEIINKFVDKLSEFEFSFLFKDLNQKLIKKNIFIISTATHYGIENLLDNFVEILRTVEIKNYNVYSLNGFDNIQKEERHILIKDITKTERQKMIDDGYLPEEEMQYLQVFEIDNKEICKFAFMTQWGKYEAELHFWKTLDRLGYMKIFQEKGFIKGDILKIRSYYAKFEDMYVQF